MTLRCDVVAVGTELLLGQVIDTNSAYIGEQLALAGIDSRHQTKVGDNLGRVVDELHLALSRADAVIVCGGLGPTHDDLTRDAISAVMGVEMHMDESVADLIRQMFSRRSRPMPENNLRQAMVPVGATVIPQVQGTAPGLICPVGDAVIYAIPGVPHEMREMMVRAIIPDLKARAGDPGVIRSRTLRTWGESESGLNERLDEVIARLDTAGNPTLAFLASGWEGIKVRLTASAPDTAGTDALLEEWEAEVRAVVGDVVFGVDDDTMESVVVELLGARGLTIGLAESVTGGLVAARLTDAPGASTKVKGAIVSYASEVKFDVLGVPRGPVVTGAAAEAMAVGARRVLAADVGLALTGVAGPEPMEGQPVGTLFVGLALGETVEHRELHLPAQREQMRQMAVISSLDLVRRRLLELPTPSIF